MKRRAAYTLLDTLLAFAIWAVIVVSTTLTSHTLVRGQRNASAASALDREVDRFALRFRMDAHVARSAAAGPQVDTGIAPNLEFRIDPETVIRYRFLARGIERLRQHPALPSHREFYYLSLSPETGWNLDAGGRVSLRLELKRASTLHGVANRSEIMATTGIVAPRTGEAGG